MNILQEATIDDEINLIVEKIRRSRSTIQHCDAMIQRMPVPDPQSGHYKEASRARARISFLEEKRKNLELLREEKDWEIVFIQTQNDHDEIWNHRGPEPNFANIKRLPDSHKLCKSVFKNLSRLW
jgi:hypothetical protein